MSTSMLRHEVNHRQFLDDAQFGDSRCGLAVFWVKQVGIACLSAGEGKYCIPPRALSLLKRPPGRSMRPPFNKLKAFGRQRRLQH